MGPNTVNRAADGLDSGMCGYNIQTFRKYRRTGRAWAKCSLSLPVSIIGNIKALTSISHLRLKPDDKQEQIFPVDSLHDTDNT